MMDDVWIDDVTRRVFARVLSRPHAFESPFAGESSALLLVVCDETATAAERKALSDEFVRSGCRWVLAAGHECSKWDTEVDMSCLATDPEFNPPDSKFIMTTWHDDEPRADVVDFMFDCATLAGAPFERFLVAFVGDDVSARAACRDRVGHRRGGPCA